MSIHSQSDLPHSPQVRYFQAPALFGNGQISRSDIPKALLLLVAAAIIGSLLGMHIVNNYVYADRKHAAEIQTALTALEPQPIPVLIDHRFQPSGELRDSLVAAGLVLIDNPVDIPEGSDADVLDVDKLPAAADQETVNKVREKGVESLAPAQAASWLADEWNLALYRSGTTDLKVKYCLFGPSTVEQAIVRAVESQGWQGSSLGETGVDQVGNTYQHGTIEIDGITYRWSVYACPLSDVYNISGLPADSWYISAHMNG